MRPAWVIVLACSALACGGPTAGAPTVHAAPASVASVKPTPLPPNTVRRSDVVALVEGGLGGFLQKLELDDVPVFVGGKFHGFRVTALLDSEFFRGVDLQAGDVVTAVNGQAIERPEQAVRVFESLASAPDIRVSFERGGSPREIRLSILEDVAGRAPAPAPSVPPKRGP